ncbi:retinaldehyde-binding protein 1 isoform X2 [Aethina tumida]|uniref:retinaldehyde-binding protein 1 isoform X2 n=1 Tax=Aethina tumida TaxID=116153 RepID=UPI002147BF57|nr:retinaldehyde-binding protein 1 isoform X2 [Aethina tumida]
MNTKLYKFANSKYINIMGIENEKLNKLCNDELYLRRFLLSTNFDVQAAFNRMNLFYELLLEYPDWYTRNNPIECKSFIDMDIRLILPGEDKEGRPIYLMKFANVDVDKMDILDAVAVDDIMLEVFFKEENIKNGLCVIIDVSNISLKMLKWLTPHNIKTGLKKLEATPIENYRFHVVKSSLIVNAAIKIIWPFLNDRIKEMVKFHYNNMQSLYEYIDKEILPTDLGGYTQIDTEKLREKVYVCNNDILESFEKRRSIFLN